jgi:cytochrome b561
MFDGDLATPTADDRGGRGMAAHAAAAYDPLSKALHWATAAIVLASFALALWPELMKGSNAVHKSLGLLLLFVLPLRMAWRLARGTGGGAVAAAAGGGGGALAAKAMHAALYLLMLALPVLGWLVVNLKGADARIFGLALPALLDPNREAAAMLLAAKTWLAYGMLGAIGLHAGAALAHHYLLRDGVLLAMLPKLRRPVAPVAQPRPARAVARTAAGGRA